MASHSSSRLLSSGGIPVPGTPASFSVAASTTSPRTINLSWAAPANSPPIPLLGYRIFRNGALVSTQTQTSYVDSGLSYSTSYSYQVFAYNAGGDSVLPASGSATTAPACNNSSGSLAATTGNANSFASGSITVPAGCFRVRIRALSGGGGGYWPNNSVHLGTCFQGYGGGGGGGYIDGILNVTPGSSLSVQAGGGGSAGNNGVASGVINQCAMNGGSAGFNFPGTNPGGSVQASPPGASITNGGVGNSSPRTGGAAALSGTNPTGLYVHGGQRIQPCGNCDGCQGGAGNLYGGGGAGGTDSGALYGETAMRGGDGAPGYVVWNFSEA